VFAYEHGYNSVTKYKLNSLEQRYKQNYQLWSVFKVEITVCGHCVYKAMWSPYIEEELAVQCDDLMYLSGRTA